MAYKRFRIVLSKGWTLLVCLVSVVVVVCSCRSKKVNKSEEPVQQEADPVELDKMMLRSDSLKRVLDNRSRSLIYGTPDVMQRRAAENESMRREIDSIDNEIRKAVQQQNGL
jgi:hypothetical protein